MMRIFQLRMKTFQLRKVGRGALAISTLLAPTLAHAQFDQYPEPGRFEEGREPMQDLLERAVKDARFKAGPLYVDPWIGIRQLAYGDNVTTSADDEKVSDFTASIGAGVRAYIPFGNSILAVHALPEYEWWNELEERRRINGRYGAGYFGNFGRLGLEIAATRQDDARFVSREIEEQVNSREDEARVELEYDLGLGLALFAGGSLREIEFRPEEGILTELDNLEREEEIVRAGVRFSLLPFVEIGVGLERSEVEFTAGGRRSNSGTSPVLQFDFDFQPVSLSFDLARRDLEPEPGSLFVPYDDVTGSVRLSWRAQRRFGLDLFADRNLVYSATEEWSWFEETGVGIAGRIAAHSRVSLRLFVEEGRDEYTAIDDFATPLRRDDFTAVGGDVTVRFGRLRWLIGGRETEYDSNLPDFDRTVTVFNSGLQLGLDGGSPWG